jgi:flagellar motility protein MotE (MotC chaperone)
MSKVGRNEPCPCGSGKKYKKCCEARDQQLAAERARLHDADRRHTLLDIAHVREGLATLLSDEQAELEELTAARNGSSVRRIDLSCTMGDKSHPLPRGAER